jgi:ubiquinone/menaquinone biosynthesis C-methylase UbiE
MADNKADAFRTTYAELYDWYLVPLQFMPYAIISAEHAKAFGPRSVLELAAGTGIATQELARTLPPDVTITATDLNQPMIDLATTRLNIGRVVWRQADAMNLPFADDSFDLIVCQFGVMFFPDKQASFREALRVLRPGGTYLFVVWDDWTKMPEAPLAVAAEVVGRLLGCAPESLVNPPYYDEEAIRADLHAANLQSIKIKRMARPAEASSAREAAVATVHGSLIGTVINGNHPSRLAEATDAVERAFREKFGDGKIHGTTHALVVTSQRA